MDDLVQEMNQFRRVLRIAARRYWSLIGILVSSMIIAVLWGANIGALYPLIDIVFDGKNLHQWSESKFTDAEERSQELEAQILFLEKELAAAPTPEARRGTEWDLEVAHEKQDLINKSTERLSKMKPWIAQYAPETPFATLGLILSLIHI